MLEIKVVLSESFDEDTQKFVTDSFNLLLEHSLVSLSKWESKYEKPFLGKDEKTSEQVRYYIECMILTPEYPPELLDKLSQANIDEIQTYIEKKMTATWFSDDGRPQPPPRETITSELVYYWMTSYQIPWEAQYWHINRLFTLIRIFGVKNGNQKKMSAREAAAQRKQLNEQRRAQYNTRG